MVVFEDLVQGLKGLGLGIKKADSKPWPLVEGSHRLRSLLTLWADHAATSCPSEHKKAQKRGSKKNGLTLQARTWSWWSVAR